MISCFNKKQTQIPLTLQLDHLRLQRESPPLLCLEAGPKRLHPLPSLRQLPLQAQPPLCQPLLRGEALPQQRLALLTMHAQLVVQVGGALFGIGEFFGNGLSGCAGFHKLCWGEGLVN